jgi:hypothetical protein
VQHRLPEQQPTIHVRGLVVHSTGGLSDPWAYFNSSSNLESTFGLGLDGTLVQYMGAAERADANYKANNFYASVETVGTGLEPWTPAQVATLTRLLDWYAVEYDVPRCATPTWDGYGFGYHIQFREWHQVAKICPGPRRIEQFKQIVLPAVAGTYNKGAPVTDGDILRVIAGVDAIQKDDFEKLRKELNADITNAANRVVRDLGGTPSVPNKP